MLDFEELVTSKRNQLGQNLRFYRERAGLSQTQLGLDCGHSQPTIARIEAGHAWPEYDTLESLTKRLKISIDDLLASKTVVVKPTPEEALDVLRKALDKMITREEGAQSLTAIQRELLSHLAAVENPKTAERLVKSFGARVARIRSSRLDRLGKNKKSGA